MWGGYVRASVTNEVGWDRKKSGEWRIGEQRYAITSQGSRLEGAGHMNSAKQ